MEVADLGIFKVFGDFDLRDGVGASRSSDGWVDVMSD